MLKHTQTIRRQLVFSCEFSEILKNAFFYRTALGDHFWRFATVRAFNNGSVTKLNTFHWSSIHQKQLIIIMNNQNNFLKPYAGVALVPLIFFFFLKKRNALNILETEKPIISDKYQGYKHPSRQLHDQS